MTTLEVTEALSVSVSLIFCEIPQLGLVPDAVVSTWILY